VTLRRRPARGCASAVCSELSRSTVAPGRVRPATRRDAGTGRGQAPVVVTRPAVALLVFVAAACTSSSSPNKTPGQCVLGNGTWYCGAGYGDCSPNEEHEDQPHRPTRRCRTWGRVSGTVKRRGGRAVRDGAVERHLPVAAACGEARRREGAPGRRAEVRREGRAAQRERRALRAAVRRCGLHARRPAARRLPSRACSHPARGQRRRPSRTSACGGVAPAQGHRRCGAGRGPLGTARVLATAQGLARARSAPSVDAR